MPAFLLILLTSLPAFGGGCPQPLRVIRHQAGIHSVDDRMLQQVATLVDCEIEVVYSQEPVSFSRRQRLLQEGEIDVMVGVSKTTEREMYSWFSISYRSEPFVAWIRREDMRKAAQFSVLALREQGWRVIGPAQGWYGEDYEQLRSNRSKPIREYKQFVQGVQLLLGAKGDLLLGDASWVIFLPAQQKELLVQREDILHREPIYFSYSKKTVSAETVKWLDVALQKVK